MAACQDTLSAAASTHMVCGSDSERGWGWNMHRKCIANAILPQTWCHRAVHMEPFSRCEIWRVHSGALRLPALFSQRPMSARAPAPRFGVQRGPRVVRLPRRPCGIRPGWSARALLPHFGAPRWQKPRVLSQRRQQLAAAERGTRETGQPGTECPCRMVILLSLSEAEDQSLSDAVLFEWQSNWDDHRLSC
jgi:hypothetical protein